MFLFCLRVINDGLLRHLVEVYAPNVLLGYEEYSEEIAKIISFGLLMLLVI